MPSYDITELLRIIEQRIKIPDSTSMNNCWRKEPLQPTLLTSIEVIDQFQLDVIYRYVIYRYVIYRYVIQKVCP